MDGRLHSHMMLYGSAITPGLLTRIAACPQLQQRALSWLDAVSCTTVSSEAWQWFQHVQERERPVPRSPSIQVQNATRTFDGFKLAGEQKALTTCQHTHTSTCQKGQRGRYTLICDLSSHTHVYECT
eukprot:GHVU01114143.1.p1 GENE.GHVU01114143.1~~GHVU01114143.1.p1  ORF type:complete len:127 (-),score=0.42 GHVU01114143.1:121-501(-)